MIKAGLSCGLVLIGALTVPASGCNGDDSEPSYEGRGTQACQEWQRALCGWVGQCNASEHAECLDQATGIQCLSDAEAERCAGALGGASCMQFPSGCDLLDMADPAPAVRACNDLITALCNRSEECEPGSRDACIASSTSNLDCSLAVAVKLSYEQCMTQIASLDCASTELPAACQGAILLDL